MPDADPATVEVELAAPPEAVYRFWTEPNMYT
jgi:uncharacterized protein YndB with AHSA1/START domain